MTIRRFLFAVVFAVVAVTAVPSSLFGRIAGGETVHAADTSAAMYHKLGMMYKYAAFGVRQDFNEAFRCFTAGAEQGHVKCIYAAGFMLYKGLGCEQSYERAVEYFRKGADNRHAPSYYMLGLCYRNGYGVERDKRKAMDWLDRAKRKGFRDAREEMARRHEETYLHRLYMENEEHDYNPNGSPEEFVEAGDTSLIAGDYQGFLMVYDWSNRYIVGEKPVLMNTGRVGDDIDGFMVIGGDTASFRATLTDNFQLRFKSGNVSLDERYTEKRKVNFRIDNILFDAWKDKICGKLSLYNMREKEPERPMYFELGRTTAAGIARDRDYGPVTAKPLPFEKTVTASFELYADADVTVTLCKMYGTKVWEKKMGRMKKGRRKIKLSPAVKSGEYIMNIQAGTQFLHTIVIKE